MAGFTPFKRHANKFNYTPRHYDPAKEAREQRRAEMRGQRRDEHAGDNTGDASYTPGQYIRSSRDARGERRREAQRGGRRKVWISFAIIALLFVFGSMLYPKLLVLFGLTETKSAVEQTISVEEEFNPMAPIIIVPNDYKEE
ncbi:MAG: hypothetical protein SNH13_05645 [Rikenellaceae bacterium]